MDFINDTLNTAKELFSAAKQKTEEAVSVGKQKLDIVSLENKESKLYAKFGKNAFGFLQDMQDLPEELAEIIAEIKENKELLAKQKEELGKMQHKRECAKCGNIIGEDSVFCNKCGEKLIFED